MSPDQVLIIIAIVTAAWTGSRILRGPLADLRARVAELEERQDFTERILLQDRPQGELGQGGQA